MNAQNEGLYVRVGRAAELAAGLSTERGAITQGELVQRADSGAVGHHCWEQAEKEAVFLDISLGCFLTPPSPHLSTLKNFKA